MNKLFNNNIIILLTASIEVKGVPFVERNNYVDRKIDYSYSINKWMKNKNLKIIFCENTGSDLDFVHKLNEKNNLNLLEILSYNDNEDAKIKGKGFSEMKMINYVFNNSKIIDENSFIIKITGRYYLKNIKSYLSILSTQNLPFINVNFIKQMDMADSRIFGFRKIFFEQYLLKYSDRIDDNKNYFFEHALRDAILQSMLEGHFRRPLPVLPIFDGYSGTTGEKLTVPFYKAWKRKLFYKIYLQESEYH